MIRLRALASSAAFLCLLAIAGCGINPQPEPPSADETNDAGGSGGGTGAGGSYGTGGHQAANPDGCPDVPPGSHDDAGGGKRSGEFSTEDPSANTDHNGAFGNLGDAGTPPPDAGDAGDAGDHDGAVFDERENGREQPPVPDASPGSVMQ